MSAMAPTSFPPRTPCLAAVCNPLQEKKASGADVAMDGEEAQLQQLAAMRRAADVKEKAFESRKRQKGDAAPPGHDNGASCRQSAIACLCPPAVQLPVGQLMGSWDEGVV